VLSEESAFLPARFLMQTSETKDEARGLGCAQMQIPAPLNKWRGQSRARRSKEKDE
jgi:hypothetical protein